MHSPLELEFGGIENGIEGGIGKGKGRNMFFFFLISLAPVCNEEGKNDDPYFLGHFGGYCLTCIADTLPTQASTSMHIESFRFKRNRILTSLKFLSR